MKNKEVYEVFISSPSDLSQERVKIKEIVDDYKSSDNIELHAVLWEKDMPVTSGVKPQKLINKELLFGADLLIGLFGSRFGSPTEEYASGTVEEIEIFINSGRPVILYFITDKDTRNPSELTEQELNDLIKINQFKYKYQGQGIYKEIKTGDIPKQLFNDLHYNIGILKQNTTYNSSMKNQNNQMEKSEKRDEKSKIESKKYCGNWWADESITKLINEYLIDKEIGAIYKGDLTFYENLQMIKGISNFTEATTTNILHQAKAYAFNKKYGDFDYEKDLRDIFPHWSKKIKTKIDELLSERSPKVLGVGSNYGRELIEIFGNNFEGHCSVLDISKEALERGIKLYPHMKFIECDMESSYPVTDKFDICLCLRTVQSRGAFRQNVIIQMDKVLSKEGLMLISIPNGYIDEKDKNNIIRGLYDHRNKIVQERRPQILANKVLNKLQDYGYASTGIETLDTEVLIWGIKK